MAEEISKDEIQVIFSEEQYKGFTIKPWTLKQVILIWPLVSRVIGKLKEAGVDVSDLGSLFTSNIQVIFDHVLEDVPQFLALSLNIDVEAAMEINVSEVTILTIKIIAKNVAHLKNSLTQVVTEMAGIAGVMTNTKTPS